MKIRDAILKFLGVLIFTFTFWHCSENPIQSDLSHSTIYLDTLTIREISGTNYWVAPNLGSNEKLYLGTKNGLNVPVSFIEIETPSPNYWNYYYDSTITIDSLHFKLYTNDSLLGLKEVLLPSLYFKSGFHFDESENTYLDFSGFTISNWIELGSPRITINTVKDTVFTSDDSIMTISDNYLSTELVWDIMSIIDNLTFSKNNNNNTPLISTGERTFAIYNPQIDYFEAFSEEATTGEKDPKVLMYYRRSVITGDSTTIDTTSATIYSSGDLSIIEPNVMALDSTKLGLSNGMGLRSVMNISFLSSSLPAGSIIRSADLILPIDTTLSSPSYTVILDPIETDSSAIDSVVVYEKDPYNGIGYPYRVSSDSSNWRSTSANLGWGHDLFIISIKNILQNIALENETILGFKVVANEKNDPFESIWFDLHHSSVQPKVEIIYVAD